MRSQVWIVGVTLGRRRVATVHTPTGRMTLMVLTVIVVRIGRLPVHVGWVIRAWIVRGWVLHVHGGRWHVHLHLARVWHVVLVVFHHVTLVFVVVFFVVSILARDHPIVLVGFAFVVLFFFGTELFPCVPNQSCYRPSFRWHSTVRRLEAQHMRRKEHVVPRLVPLPIGSLVRRLVLCHLFFVPLAVFLGTATRKGVE